jgi:hypothetical protein
MKSKPKPDKPVWQTAQKAELRSGVDFADAIGKPLALKDKVKFNGRVWVIEAYWRSTDGLFWVELDDQESEVRQACQSDILKV